MPLTSKGEEIKAAMEKEYGKEKGESVFYASANKGTIKGVHDAVSALADAVSGLSGRMDVFEKRRADADKKREAVYEKGKLVGYYNIAKDQNGKDIKVFIPTKESQREDDLGDEPEGEIWNVKVTRGERRTHIATRDFRSEKDASEFASKYGAEEGYATTVKRTSSEPPTQEIAEGEESDVKRDDKKKRADAGSSVLLATAHEDLGLCPAGKAASEAKKAANELGQTVTWRDPTTDKVLGKASPDKKRDDEKKEEKPETKEESEPSRREVVRNREYARKKYGTSLISHNDAAAAVADAAASIRARIDAYRRADAGEWFASKSEAIAAAKKRREGGEDVKVVEVKSQNSRTGVVDIHYEVRDR